MTGLLKYLLPVLAGIYFLSPIDVLPDLIPYAGRADDLIVLGLVIYYIYRGAWPRWLRGRPTSKTSDRSERTRGGEQTERDPGDREESASRNPYEILGVGFEATEEDIRSAYRRESQRYHPDKVAHLGEDLQELAKMKFLEIKRAYDELRAKGGW